MGCFGFLALAVALLRVFPVPVFCFLLGEPPPLLAGPGRETESSNVYPTAHDGGATTGGLSQRRGVGGLAPRGRGNLHSWWHRIAPLRSIPAWAGQPTCRPSLFPPVKVYPRVGGATGFFGSLIVAWGGLSPRGRGNLLVILGFSLWPGSIPGCTGPACLGLPADTSAWVHPRLRGATSEEPDKGTQIIGLSPRGRGGETKSILASLFGTWRLQERNCE